jgi:methyl-accepting chemotaxis protein
MTNEEKLRAVVRKIIQQELKEISTTAGAGPYLTPFAFRGNVKKNVAKMKNIATQLGYTLSKKGEKELNRPADKMENISEAKTRYHEYKKDESATPTQKIAKAISEVNKNIQEIERIIKMNARLQKESNVSSEALYRRTQQGLIKLEARLISIAGKIREIRGK